MSMYKFSFLHLIKSSHKFNNVMSDFHDLLKEYIFTEWTLLIKIGTISFNILLPTRNNFFFFNAGIIKCNHPWGNKFIECHFSILWISEAFLPQEVIKMFEKVKICRWEVRLNMVDGPKFHSLMCVVSDEWSLKDAVYYYHWEEYSLSYWLMPAVYM